MKTIGGQVPEKGDSFIENPEAGSLGGVPIFACTWQIEYFLTEPPQGKALEVPANPRAAIET